MDISFLSTLPLFHSVPTEALSDVLTSLFAKERNYDKENYILSAGNPGGQVGIITAGSANVIQEDFWGNRTILTKVGKGELFGEAFACAGSMMLPVSVVGAERCTVLFLDYGRLIHSDDKDIPYFTTLSANMLRILAKKNIMLTQKIQHTAQKTTRQKLISYLSQQALQNKNHTFIIPFDRQELADYLSVERSAMSKELGILRDDGILLFRKNHFTLLKQNG